MAVVRPRTTSTASFAELGVPEPLTKALRAAGITAPFPIQTATLPDSLRGRNILGRARTGSGKTYAFVLPVLARLAETPERRRPGHPRALILAPTRELAAQIERAASPLAAALSLRVATIVGGVAKGPQRAVLQRGVDVVVACPGRLADHIAAGDVSLDSVRITVVDEADHMADLGFLPAVRRLLDQTPRDGQRLLFSATLDAAVDVLVNRYVPDATSHSVEPVTESGPPIEHHVLQISADDRFRVLLELVTAHPRTLVFTRTKHGAKRLTHKLVGAGISGVELHGDLSQNVRTRNLAAFTDNRASALVATDIAARGIDIDRVALVIHADPPADHKAYLHRSGRTARAGADGLVVTLASDEQAADVRSLMKKAAVRPITARVRPGDPALTRFDTGPTRHVGSRRARSSRPAR